METVAAIMHATDVVWWLSGGQALDRFLGHVTREHGDIDVSIPRHDLARRHTAPRPPRIADRQRRAALRPRRGAGAGVGARPLGTRRVGGPWRVQINLEPVEGDDWVFRRDPRVRRPLEQVVHDRDSLPRVNPAVQLLWKAKDPLPKDEIDLVNVLPLLPPRRTGLAPRRDRARPSRFGVARTIRRRRAVARGAPNATSTTRAPARARRRDGWGRRRHAARRTRRRAAGAARCRCGGAGCSRGESAPGCTP